jgi:hypothetical protein
MSILDETRFVERIQFFNGQRLFASDLQSLEAFNREMRWLHNTSLHQAGIGKGYAVYGKKGDRQVTVQAGYAIDSQGREIVLTQEVILPVPPVSGEDDGLSVFYDLTVSYPDDSALEEAETREGVCLPRGAVRLQEAPIFCWVRLERDEFDNLHVKNTKLAQDIKNNLKLVLTRAEVLNCQLEQDLSLAERLNARPPAQPYIACGEVKPVDWQVWEIELEQQSGVSVAARVGLTAVIDTSEAGFLTGPCYNARIEGPRPAVLNIDQPPSPGLNQLFSFLGSSFGAFLSAGAQNGTFLDGALYVRGDTPEFFTVFVPILPPYGLMNSDGSEAVFDAIIDFANENWSIVWMGIEG